MAALRTRGQAPRLLAVTQLHGRVAIALGSANLQDETRTRLDHGDADGTTIFTVDLRHSDFTTQKTDRHGIYLYIHLKLFSHPAATKIPQS